MSIDKIKEKLLIHKRGVALGLAILMSGSVFFSCFEKLAIYADIETAQPGSNKYWNTAKGSFLYYGKDRKYFGHLRVGGKAAICLDATKKLSTGKSGSMDEYVFADTQNFPTGISREGAEMLGYAFKLGQIASGGEEITNPYWYCICQCLCWMIESKGGNVTWEDLDAWRENTKELGKYLLLDYSTFEAAVDKYADEATRQLRPEAVSEFTSKYANEAPILTLDYDEDTGIWSKDFELIDYLEAVDKGFEQVWMQYFLDWDKAPARVGLEGKLTMEHKADGGRNWVHVEFNGDIEELKSAGPIPLHFEEGSDGALYTYSLESISIWTPADSEQQHLLGGVKTIPWTVYMTFGGIPPEWEPTPGSYEVIVNTHKHDETFISNYNIELYKYDFETGKPLANSEFEILEKMDTSQFDDSVDQNGGNPDGTYPLDDLNFDKFKKIRDNTEKPTDDWQVCGTYTTDENGLISHKDIFQYDFTATYCDGHPEPIINYPEEPESDPDEDGNDEAHDAWEEECAKLEEEAQKAWEMAVQECESRTNFHSIDEGEGKAACEEYRNDVWQAFIELEYQYTAREKTARSGYILHDIHTDDNPIETVIFDSSEANSGGDYSKATGKFDGNIAKRALGNGSQANKTSLEMNQLNVDTNEAVSKVATSSNSVSISSNDVPIVKSSNSENTTQDEDDFVFEEAESDDEVILDDEDKNSDEYGLATPSNATLQFSEIGESKSIDLYAGDDEGSEAEDLHCTWNGVNWTFEGDPDQEFSDSEMEEIDQDSYDHENVAHIFRVYDHRTEGEIHINKRDLDLYNNQNNDYSAYADSNGDSTLEGAVYGLFAAEDIVHPDGKTGTVFTAGELVSIATTDRNGDASFMAITETSNTSKTKKNLYIEDITTQLMNNGINIDERTYQNNLDHNGNEWIGRPLILGRYYVKELSRSEGYELSVTGVNKSVTNFGVVDDAAFESTGTARFSGYKQDDQYGDNQEDILRFDISYKDIEDGYDITISGYPAGTKFYTEEQTTEIVETETVVGTHTEITDVPILAKGGEYVLDKDGLKIPLLDSSGNQVYDTTPIKGNFYPVARNNKYPNGSAVVSDMNKYNSGNIDIDFIKSEGQSILKQIGYSNPSNKNPMPWKTLSVSGGTNGEIIENLVNKLRENSFYDSYIIDKITKNGSNYEFVIRYGYVYKSAKAYIDKDGTLYVKNSCTNILENGSSVAGYYYVEYSPDEYSINGKAYTIETKKIDGDAIYGTKYNLVNDYAPLYKTYAAGEQKYGLMLKSDGTYEYGLLFETKTVEDKAIVSTEVTNTNLTEVAATYADGIYTIHIDTSDISWDDDALKTDSFRAVVPVAEEKTNIKQNSTITPTPQIKQIDAGSYVKYKTLTYNSQHDVYSGNETRTVPIGVQERPIKQKIKVVKDIQTMPDSDSYLNDSYSEVHKENLSPDGYNRWYNKTIDWLSSLLGGTETDDSASKVSGFQFKAYLKSNLERLYRDENGTIVWLDRNGNALVPEYQDTDGDGNYETFVWKNGNTTIDFPEQSKTEDDSIFSSNVQKIFTKVEHNINSTTTGDISNNVWAEYADPQTGETTNVGELRGDNTSQDGENGEAIKSNGALYSYDDKNTNVKKTDKINNSQNSGYTRLLETRVETIEDGAGKTREVEQYNYEKFFDALAAANTDKWDNDMFASKKNYPGQHWFETFEEKYQKDDADPDGTISNTDGVDADGTAGGDRDTSFKPFQWIREKIFGTTQNAKDDYPATHDNDNLENVINTSAIAHSNAEASDAVRQFAITWYLDDEVAKLVTNNGYDEDVAKKGSESYQEEVYDQALYQALIKTYNYLKPFYEYDLDTIYSVVWDSDKNGGSDGDVTTVSANTLYKEQNADDGYYYGVSSYLPYGTYVLVEQQPVSFKNKNYKTDKPKEVSLPSVYEENGNADSPEVMNAYYNYSVNDTPEDLLKKYKIRFNEEWADNHTDDLRNYVIRAHNFDGDYEIYKYGLDVDKLKSTITYNGNAYNYDGFSIKQEINDPLKDYYNNPLVDSVHDGGNANSHYFADDKNKGVVTVNGSTYVEDAIEKRYHYGSISEHSGEASDVLYQHGPDKDDNNPSGFFFKDNVKTMTGNQTAYDEKYASMLVPWSVVEPVASDDYDSDNFTGYADSKFRNTFYATKIRIEKLDSETGENLLHDDAIFSIYAASRYTTKDEIKAAGAPEGTKVGDVKFYMQDTVITGSKEFLEAMGASNITPIAKGGKTNTYSGTVSAGTPVCLEEEQIVMEDAIGNKTGTFKVYATLNDIEVLNEEDTEKSYRDQNVGYIVTPQPLGSGVYVIVETKAPAGYAKTKPVAIEIYSDSVSYYMNGSMVNKVDATIYEGNLMDK